MLILLVLLAGCSREPSFDERYAATQQRLEARSAEIEQQLATTAPPPAAPAE